MNIQGPSGPPPVDNEAPVTVTPGVASSATKSAAQAPIPSVQVQLSPALFKQGQILQVVIAKVEQDALLLTLNNRLTDSKGDPLRVQFRVPAFPGAQPGQQLSVQVAEIRNNLPVLRLVGTQPAPAQDIANAFRQNLPPTQALQTVFDHVSAIKTSPTSSSVLPTEVRDQLDRLWRTLPEANTIQRAENLRQALKHAGPFLEAQLAKLALNNERVFPAMDVRAQLLRLAEVIRQHLPQTSANQTSASSPANTPASTTPHPPAGVTIENSQTQTVPTDKQDKVQSNPALPNVPARQLPQYDGMQAEKILQQLLQQLDAGLARVQQQQLQMLPTEIRPQWLIELPLKTPQGVDVFDIRIQPDSEQQGNRGNTANYPWTVMLAFNLDGLGPVRAQISLYQGRISTYWWAEQQHTVALFHQYRDFLENRLAHVGVPFHQLVCEYGIPEPKPLQNKIPYNSTNLDERV